MPLQIILQWIFSCINWAKYEELPGIYIVGPQRMCIHSLLDITKFLSTELWWVQFLSTVYKSSCGSTLTLDIHINLTKLMIMKSYFIVLICLCLVTNEINRFIICLLTSFLLLWIAFFFINFHLFIFYWHIFFSLILESSLLVPDTITLH